MTRGSAMAFYKFIVFALLALGVEGAPSSSSDSSAFSSAPAPEESLPWWDVPLDGATTYERKHIECVRDILREGVEEHAIKSDDAKAVLDEVLIAAEEYKFDVIVKLVELLDKAKQKRVIDNTARVQILVEAVLSRFHQKDGGNAAAITGAIDRAQRKGIVTATIAEKLKLKELSADTRKPGLRGIVMRIAGPSSYVVINKNGHAPAKAGVVVNVDLSDEGEASAEEGEPDQFVKRPLQDSRLVKHSKQSLMAL